VVSLKYILACLFLVFFFSSRRRHTRFSRDWSSDVCSSDLHHPLTRHLPSQPALRAHRVGGGRPRVQQHPAALGAAVDVAEVGSRSEERRVGKECRSRWARDQEKKKE